LKQEVINKIINKLKEGDNSCFVDITKHCKSYCIGSLIKKTKCTQDEAEELFIEAILELREMVISGKTTKILNLKSYIFGICYNLWLTEIKKAKKKHEAQDHVERYFYDYLRDDALLNEELVYKKTLLEISNKALKKLGDNCQDIIKQYYLDNLSMSEIAEKFDFSSPDVAKTTKSRCFKKLMNEVEKLKVNYE